MEYIDFFLIFFSALAISVFLTPLLIYLAHKKQIFDHPDIHFAKSRRVHTLPTPRLGGVAIVTAFFTTIVFWRIPNFLPIYFCSLILFTLGLWDDLKNLGATIRLFFQIIASCAVVYFSDLSLKFISISSAHILHLPPQIGFLLAVFIIIGAINSMNMVDGLDGLASGALLIGMSILSYFVFVYFNKHSILIGFTIPLLGSLIGFLKFNTFPSKIFMGDSGSNWCGFLVGVLILKVSNLNPSIPLISILLAFSIPIFDTAHVILMRILNGQNPMHADNRHLHHSLMKIGFSHSQSVGILYFFMFLFGTLGMLPVAFKSQNLSWLPWCAVLILFTLCGFLIPYRSVLLKKILQARLNKTQNQRVKKPIKAAAIFIESFQRYIIYGLFFTTPFLVFIDQSAIGILCGIICLAMGISFFLYKKCSFISACIAVSVIQLLFSNSHVYKIEISIFNYSFNGLVIYNLLFLYLFISTVFSLTIALQRKFFVITPTDILLVLIPLLILMIPDTWDHGYGMRIIVLHSIVLFAALRLHPYMLEKASQTFASTETDSDNSEESMPRPSLNPNP